MTSSRSDRNRLRLRAERRLRSRSQFERVYEGGKRFSDGFFTVVTRPNDAGQPRIGLAVALKAAGSAVERNRIRRLIRESFRLQQHEIPPLDFVVSARAARIRQAENAELRASLNALWDRVKRQCASSSKP